MSGVCRFARYQGGQVTEYVHGRPLPECALLGKAKLLPGEHGQRYVDATIEGERWLGTLQTKKEADSHGLVILFKASK